jgi:UrcA family protein
MKNHSFGTVSIIATLPLGFTLGVAHAESSAAVETRDLDLRNSRDVAALYARIESRAANVCQDAASPWDAGRVAFVRKCRAAALDDAVAHANVSALTALHEEKVRAARVAQNHEG